jgi:hypothetical protein
MKSHALLRTNTGLTTNAKLVVGSNYELYLDCIDSRPELNNVRYRKYRFKKENFIDELIPHFFRDTPSEIAYSVKYDGDNSIMYTDFAKQYDDLYNFGARNIYDNKDYKEEFEFFAPLHISKSTLPTHFIIFRVDGPGLIDLNRLNFKQEILDRLKVVKVFDMTPKTELGEFIRRNVTENRNFPATSLEIDFSKLQFSYFIGMDYETGGYTRRSQMLESVLENEFTFMDMERLIYKGFAENKIIYPHIINFSFLFDDSPATPKVLRKWSINRYLGFYFNKLQFALSISPNKFSKVKPNVKITFDNNLEMLDGSSPFLDEKDLNPYIELEGRVYKIEKFKIIGEPKRKKVLSERGNFVDKIVPSEIVKYKILSEKSHFGKQSLINSNVVNIVYENEENVIYLQSGSNFQISDFENCDMWIIKIGDLYHKLSKNSNGQIIIVSDYAFLQSEDKFEYYINESDTSFRKTINLVSGLNVEPVEFEIYRCEFTDIKDWDTDIVETEFSKFEYEEDQFLTENDEPKFYLTNLNSTSKPKQLDDYIIEGEVSNIPASSEYTANNETFRLIENDLNELWRKNSVRVKWGFQNSLSDSDYPYLLNNSFLADDFNKTINPYATEVIRNEKNLDYFYTINPDSAKYVNYSLHVKPLSGDKINNDYYFDVLKYMKTDLDYFTYFFGQKTDYEDGKVIKNTHKWSYFNPSDDITTNQTLFRGLKFKIYDVASVNVIDGKLDKFNVKITNKFDDYKFSILVSENNGRVVTSPDSPNRGVTQSFYNSMNWTIIDNWKMDKPYYWYELSIWNDTLFITTKPINPELQKIGFDSKIGLGTRIETRPDLNPGNQKLTGNRPSDPFFEDLSLRYSKTGKNLTHFPLGTDYIIETPFLSSAKVDGSVASNYSYYAYPQVHPFIYYEGEWWYDNGIPGLVGLWNYQTFPPMSQTFYKGKIWVANPSGKFINPKAPGSQQTKNIRTIPGTKGQIINSTPLLGRFTFTSDPFWLATPFKMEDIRNKLYSSNISYSEFEGVKLSSDLNPTFNPWGRFQRIPLWSSSQEYKGRKSYQNYIGGSLVGYDLINSGFNTGVIQSRTLQDYISQAFDIVLYKDVVYGLTGSDTLVVSKNSLPPDQNPNWVRLYSLKPDKDFVYDNSFRGNNVIEMNNRYYMYLNDSNVVATTTARNVDVIDGTLDNGIVIYINRKFKNILINLCVNDHTYDPSVLELNKGDVWPETSPNNVSKIIKLGNKLKSINRDEIYSDIFQKLTANNFMNAINDLSNKYDFINSVKYVITEETGEIKIYDFDNLDSLTQLPFFITCEGPDEFYVKRDTNIVESVESDSNLLKPRFKLKDGEISSREEINYVGDVPYASLIRYNRIEKQPVPNFSGLKNEIFNRMYRHSGFYSPIFRNIELFRSYTETDNLGNFKFDTSLTYFGLSGERIVSKVNRTQNLLKLNNVSSAKSIYPMLDEFGYHVVRTFIFKSTWDFKFHYETTIPVQELKVSNNLLRRQEKNNKTLGNRLL